jgi:ribose transport system permease protein
MKMERKLSTGKSIGQILIKFRTVVILLLFFAIFTMLKPIFINPVNLLNMLKRMSYVVIVGFGMTFIITLGGLDLSVGSTSAIVGVGLAMLIKGKEGMGVVPAILIMLVVALALGFLNGLVSVKGKIEPFLVTLATMNIYRGIALVMSAGKPVQITVPNFADVFGNGRLFGAIPTPVIITLLFFLLTWYLFKKTKFGFYIRCIGGNIEAARVAGIRTDFVKICAYTLNGFYAFMSGLILAALMNSGLPDIGKDLALDSISGVILGGTAISGGVGSVWGTVGGCLIIATLNSGMSLLGAQYQVQILVKGVVIILAVLMDNVLKSRTTA